jgi:chemotaxis protein methyltransferase CheR
VTRVRLPDPTTAPMTEEEFRLLREDIRDHCGLWYRDDSRYLLEKRLQTRLQALDLPDFTAYLRYLRFDPGREAELEEASEILTTNETYFFREPYQLHAFSREILPALAQANAKSRRLRVLSAGCSTGEEVYTLAALVKESRLFEGWEVELVGSDISRRCVAQARAAAYGEHAFRVPDAVPLRRWFHLRGGKWVVDDALRALVRFQRENLLSPRALSTVQRLDAVFCRNMMIYFDLESRRALLRRLHLRMRPGAWLLLGHAESLLNVTADFDLVHLTSDLVYRKPGGPGAEDAP